MQRTAMVVGALLFGMCLLASAQAPKTQPWWVGIEFGEGQLQLTSDQQQGTRHPTFAFGIVGGHKIGSRARVGMQVNGWLLQASNFNDPTVGESVSNVMFLVDAFPVRKSPLFLRGGVGLAMYTNNRPTGTNGNGLGWTAGVGYEIPLTRNVGLAPIVDYASGHLGDGRNITGLETGRQYSVIEFKAALAFHFGKTK
jgi:hypothetical protein